MYYLHVEYEDMDGKTHHLVDVINFADLLITRLTNIFDRLRSEYATPFGCFIVHIEPGPVTTVLLGA